MQAESRAVRRRARPELSVPLPSPAPPRVRGVRRRADAAPRNGNADGSRGVADRGGGSGSGLFFQRVAPFLRRRRQRQRAAEAQNKPIYIYPGLLRVVRDKAIALDNQCPAVLYKCRECRRADVCATERESGGGMGGAVEPGVCVHQTACSICLDEFHGKDLVRKLPCNASHVFHSKCILDWFAAHHRCPLCNEAVASSGEARGEPHLGEPRRVAGGGGEEGVRPSVRSMSLPAGGGKVRRPRGPRTYSYIVHDNVRMELNRDIPV